MSFGECHAKFHQGKSFLVIFKNVFVTLPITFACSVFLDCTKYRNTLVASNVFRFRCSAINMIMVSFEDCDFADNCVYAC